MEIKPNDTYRVEFAAGLSEEKIRVLMMLYQPLVGGDGVLIYLTLASEAINAHAQMEHKRLFTLMNLINADTFERARLRLESYMLLRTYMHENRNNHSYIYVLNPPLSAPDFFASGYLSRMYAKYVGEKNLTVSRGLFQSGIIPTNGYKDISAPVKNLNVDTFDNETDYISVKPQYQFEGSEDSLIQFDYNRFIVMTSSLVFPAELRTHENMNLIGRLATLYGISPERMSSLVGQCVNLADVTFDAKRFEILCKKERPTESTEVTDIYKLSPYSFLQSLQKGIPVSKADGQLLDYLSKEMNFPNEVINVMIEYILKINDNRLNPKFVEMVAGTWVRNGVSTKEQAIAETKKKSFSQKSHKKQLDLPQYYKDKQEGKEVVSPATEEQQERIRRLQQELKHE